MRLKHLKKGDTTKKIVALRHVFLHKSFDLKGWYVVVETDISLGLKTNHEAFRGIYSIKKLYNQNLNPPSKLITIRKNDKDYTAHTGSQCLLS